MTRTSIRAMRRAAVHASTSSFGTARRLSFPLCDPYAEHTRRRDRRGPMVTTAPWRRAEPELVALLILMVAAGVAKAVCPRSTNASPPDGKIRVCVYSTTTREKIDPLEIVNRFTATCSNRYDILFGLFVECDDITDVIPFDSQSYPSQHRERVIVHHTTRMEGGSHEKRLGKMVKRFVNGLEDMVVFADARVHPEFGWDINLIHAVSDGTVVTCPLCVHPAAFPTLRQRGNGDVVRGEARPFSHPGDAGTLVASVCLCHEFLACQPLQIPQRSSQGSVRLVVPTFPVISPAPHDVEDDVLDHNLHRQVLKLTKSQRLGLSQAPSGLEMYHKYGSTSAAKLAMKLDRRRV